MYSNLIIGFGLSILGLYLVINHNQYGKRTMDSYRRVYHRLGLKRLEKSVTKKDDIEESKMGVIVGTICLIIGLNGIVLFFFEYFN